MYLITVINFCTYDFRLLHACIEGVRNFSKKILITVCDHYFDGTQENYALLEHVFRQFPDCTFIEYAFDPEQSYRQFTPYYPEHYLWRHEWHNTGRWIAYHFLPKECDAIFFIDADEIVDQARFDPWFECNDVLAYSAIRFSAHWYFREARYRATSHDDASLLVNRRVLTPCLLWNSDERMGIFESVSGEKIKGVKGIDGHPLIDHYSWVRTKEELLKKFGAWGHHWERDWKGLLEKEYAEPFKGIDFIRRYSYLEIAPGFDPLQVHIPAMPYISLEEHKKNIRSFSNVISVDRQYMQRKALVKLCL
jgi:hypothetical protein